MLRCRVMLALSALAMLLAMGGSGRLRSPGIALAAERTQNEPSSIEPTSDEEESSFDDLLSWLKEFRELSQALHDDAPEQTRVQQLRQISFLLGDRGLYDEADRLLTRAVESSSADAEHAFSDSLRLAEYRMAAGRNEEALNIVQRLSIQDQSREEKIRVAVIQADAGAHFAALGILEDLMPSIPAQAKLLRIRCLWESGAAEKTLRAIHQLSLEDLPEPVAQSLVLLRADCLFTLGRLTEARDEYERAKRGERTAERAAWIRFQLGNIAHRQGRLNAARAFYCEAMESWPKTFYASQSEWFLRTTERIAKITDRSEVSRGG